MCKKGNFLRDVCYWTTPSIGIRDSFLKTDVKDKNRAEWKLVDLFMKPLTPKLSKALVLLGKYDRYPNCTISLFMWNCATFTTKSRKDTLWDILSSKMERELNGQLWNYLDREGVIFFYFFFFYFSRLWILFH